MIRLQRKGIVAPADWRALVDAAFPDDATAKAFWKKAAAFEKLAEHGGKRKRGFVRYAPNVLPVGSKGRPEFPAVWRKHEELRQKIAGMSAGFCAYCQSPVSSTHAGKEGKKKPPGQIEHFLPKSRFPAHAYDWDNYFLSCGGCNNAKGDKWPVGGYVRPDEGKPGARFVFARDGKVRAKKGDPAAENTVEDMDLQRYWLAYHRRGAIEAHLVFVERLLGSRHITLGALLMPRRVAFSEAINQNVRRAWAKRRQKRRR